MYRQVSPNVLMGGAILSPANIWLSLVSVYGALTVMIILAQSLMGYPNRQAVELYLTQMRENAL